MFADTSWEADGVSNGEEALTQLEAHRDFHSYHLVLADILMPGMDGLTLLGQLRARYPQIPVVIMTVKNTPEHVLGSLRREASAYIGKPFSRDALLSYASKRVVQLGIRGRHQDPFGQAELDFAADLAAGLPPPTVSPSSCVNCPAIWIPTCANRSPLLSASCS